MTAPVPLASGGYVPGRPVASGDHPANDRVPAMLSPGEIVLPRTVAQAEDAPERAADFVEAVTRSRKPKREPAGYGEVLKTMRELDAKLAALGARAG